MENYPLLSDQEIEEKPIFNSLQEAQEDSENAYSLELMGEEFFPDEFVDAIADFPRLQILVIHDNPDFDEIPAGFAKLKNLQYLEIRNCPLKSIAPELGDCAELAGLVLVDVRPLASLPDGLGKLEKLNYVEISSTNIEKLPATISNWKSVEELNVSGNNLVELPEEIGGMESLQVLRTYGNYAMYVPAGLAKLSKLESYDHGDIDYRDISEADLKAGLPNLVFRQVTSQDRIRPTAS